MNSLLFFCKSEFVGGIARIKFESVGAMIHRPIVSIANNNGSAVKFSLRKMHIRAGRWVNAPTIYISVCEKHLDKLLFIFFLTSAHYGDIMTLI